MRAQASARKKEILIVFILSLAAFMGALDVSIVNISMPTIARCFKISTGDVSWVIPRKATNSALSLALNINSCVAQACNSLLFRAFAPCS